MKKQATKKPTAKKLKPTAHKLGHHPDLRTKAGRAWKAAQVQKAQRAKARAREEAKLAAAKDVTGRWLTKAEMDKKLHLASLARGYGMGEKRLEALLLGEPAREQDTRGVTHYDGDPCPGGHLHDLHGDTLELPRPIVGRMSSRESNLLPEPPNTAYWKIGV